MTIMEAGKEFKDGLGSSGERGKNNGMKRLILLAALAGCTTASPPPAPPQIADTCGAARFGDLIGQDATALERRLFLGQVRVIRPGDMVTMDFRPDRINIRITENETIQQIDCG